MGKKKRNVKKPPAKMVAPKRKFRMIPWLALLLLPALAVPFLIPSRQVKNYTFEVIARKPHDPNAYTQGLAYHNGFLFEGTGLYGQSSLRKVDLASGSVLTQIDLDRKYFGEGIAIVHGTIVQLTWREGKVFVYNSDDLKLLREYKSEREGWGLTFDGEYLIASDGSETLYFHDPVNFEEIRKVTVTENGLPIPKLNELEFIKGEIWANIWQTNTLRIINPKNGEVTGKVNLTGLLKPSERNGKEDVLNGIAYDPASDRIFVTGKKYSYLYEIKLKNLNN